MTEVTLIPKDGLLCDVCGKPLAERNNGRVRMTRDAILTEWGLYCVECFIRYRVPRRVRKEIWEHLEAGEDVTDSSLMGPVVIASP